MKTLYALVLFLVIFQANASFSKFPGTGGGGGGGAITSVFGRTGVVTATSGDYTTTLVTEGSKLFFTTARAQTACVDDTAYNATTWDAVTNQSPSKNAVRDEIEVLLASIATNTSNITANTTAIAGKEPSITATTSADYYRGDKVFATLNKAAVGLSNVANVDTTNASNISSGTLPAAQLPNPSSTTLGGIRSAASVSNQWINSISTAGAPSLSQPSFSNISGTATTAQMPALTSAHLFVGNVSNVPTDVAVSGDVTIDNTGATTVNTVNGSTAANVHAAELLANAAAVTNTVATIVKRDGGGNAFNTGSFNRAAVTATAGGTTAMSQTSSAIQIWTGTQNQTIKLPATSTYLVQGATIRLVNQSTGTLTVQDFSAGAIDTVAPGKAKEFIAQVSGSPGTWGVVTQFGDGITASSTDTLTNKILSGNFGMGVASITTTTTLTATSNPMNFITASAAYDITLPAASAASSKVFFFRRISSGSADNYRVRIKPAGADTINDGLTAIPLYGEGDAELAVWCNGANNWQTFLSNNSGFDTQGGLAVTTSQTLNSNQRLVPVDSTSGNVTETLPPVAQAIGRRYTITKNVAANSVIVAGSGAELVGNANTQTLTTIGSTLEIFDNGSFWSIIGDTRPTNLAISTAGGVTGVLPAANGGVPTAGTTSQVLTKNSNTNFDYSWATPSGGGTPGGSTTQVQFNNAGAFGGNANFVWDTTNSRLGIGNAVTPARTFHLDAIQTSAVPAMQWTHGTNTGILSTDGTIAGYATNGSTAWSLNNQEVNAHLLFQVQGTNYIDIDDSVSAVTLRVAGSSQGFLAVTAAGGTTSGGVGVGVSSPSAALHLMAGTATTNNAPLKFTSGTVNTTPAAGTVEYDGTHTFTKANNIRYRPGGVLTENFADAGNTSTTETDLYSYTTPANLLDTNGHEVVARYGGIFVNSTSTKQVKAYFGGTVIFDSGALSTTAAASWDLSVMCVRVSSTVVRCTASMSDSGVSVTTAAQYTEVTGLTLSGTNILKITGTSASAGAATNDIVAKLASVEFKPNN